MMLAGGCGEVASEPTDAAVAPITYKGMLAQTAPTMFGGGTFCTYTVTFRQIEVEVGIVPTSKQVTTGRVQNLNVEEVVPTTPVCPFGPADPTISNYTLASATPTASGMTLMFQGAAANTPVASLTVTLSPTSSGYTAALAFHRTDLGPPLDWRVTTTVTLSPQKPRRSPQKSYMRPRLTRHTDERMSTRVGLVDRRFE